MIERRRFVTRRDVEDAHAAGRPLQIAARDVITDEAATRARDLGLEIVRGAATTPPPVVPADQVAVMKAAVKAAVEAELGPGTPGVDAAVDRAFARRQRA